MRAYLEEGTRLVEKLSTQVDAVVNAGHVSNEEGIARIKAVKEALGGIVAFPRPSLEQVMEFRALYDGARQMEQQEVNYYLSQVANEGWTFDELREKLGIESTLRYWMGNIRGDLTIIQEAVDALDK